MIDISKDDPVDNTSRQLRIVDLAQDRHNAINPVAVGELPHDIEHLRLNIDTVNPAVRRNTLHNPAGIVTRAATDISNNITRFKPHRVKHRFGHFLLFTLHSLKPLCAAKTHKVRRHPMQLTTLGYLSRHRLITDRPDQ